MKSDTAVGSVTSARNVAPIDRRITATMTAQEWGVILAMCGRPNVGFRADQHNSIVIVNKLETQVGGVA